MDEQSKWYVVHTFSGYENKVCSNLLTVIENRGLQDMIPESVQSVFGGNPYVAVMILAYCI